MHYVYILLCKDQKFYVGFTSDLSSRYIEHKNGKVTSTKCRLPLKLIFYECYLNKYGALRRENYLKTEKGRTTLRYMLKEFLLEPENMEITEVITI